MQNIQSGVQEIDAWGNLSFSERRTRVKICARTSKPMPQVNLRIASLSGRDAIVWRDLRENLALVYQRVNVIVRNLRIFFSSKLLGLLINKD